MAKKVLTAEEILKMPDDDYMNAQQLEFFRRRLTTWRRNFAPMPIRQP